jgi:hypothetical protein
VLENPRTEFLRQEVELVEGERPSFEIRILLWPHGEIAIRCADVRLSWAAIDDNTRSDHQNEVIVRR